MSGIGKPIFLIYCAYRLQKLGYTVVLSMGGRKTDFVIDNGNVYKVEWTCNKALMVLSPLHGDFFLTQMLKQ